jgi:L-lactate dehydrogenase complex protein LldG
MSTRDALYQRIDARKRSDNSADERAALHLRLQEVGRAAASADISLFVARAEEAGAQVLRCATAGDVPNVLEDALVGCRHIVLALDPLTMATGLNDALRAADAGREVCTVDDIANPTGVESAKLYGARMDVGIGSALAGLADSGAVLLRSSQYESRSLSLLSGIHVALLSARHIFPDILHAAQLLREQTGQKGSSAVTLVGGPSKTADIEKVLVTGVHGPGRFIIVLIDDTEDTAPPRSE